ncbi:BON domain-containing protein [Candidatus Nitrospira salsa]
MLQPSKIKSYILKIVLIGFISIALIPNLSRAESDSLNITDKDITVAIESRFIIEENVPANFINVTTENGIVTLSGNVDNLLAKDRAEKIVESVRGVRAIIDLIAVEPFIQPEDEIIKKNVNTALADDPAADSYELTIQVDDGTVTLRGMVESWQEKQLSETVTKSVKGVKNIRNEITVNPVTIRSDSEIEAEIIRRLQSDVWVHEGLIGIIVEKNQVTLTGSVGSLAEKYRAFTDAWVNGVTSVNVEQLEVEWWARDRMLQNPTERVSSNTQKEEAIRHAFSYSPRLHHVNISIQVKQGTAILTGIVNNVAARHAAEEAARQTVGIWRVRNLIKVRSTDPANDEALERRVQNAFNQHPMIDRYDLIVMARNGTISIEGYLQSPTEILEAVRTAATVKGVTKVLNYLEIKSSSMQKSDEEIWEDIRRSIWWDPRLYDQDITIVVDDGVITLTGKVPSIIEWRRATKIAKEAGAERIRNRLKVIDGPDFLTS